MNYTEIEWRKREDKILSHMESLGIETPRSHDPKPKKKKSHSCKKAQANTLMSI
jgi:hypothetical protein